MNYKPYGDGNEAGYTLIEVVVAIQLFLIVLSLLYVVFVIGHRFTVEWEKDMNSWRDFIFKERIIERELLKAKSIFISKGDTTLIEDENYLLSHIYAQDDSIYIQNDLKKKVFLFNKNK